MNHTHLLTTLFLSLGAGHVLAQAPPTAGIKPPSAPAKPAKPVDMDAVSYIIGANLGTQLKTSNVEANLDKVTGGIKDGFSGAEPKYSK
jgi:hypothetical protein